MRILIITVLLFLSFQAFSQGPVDRIELGYQTTKRGIVWVRPGLPTHEPVWRISRDTNSILWHNLTTGIRYDWSYQSSTWNRKDAISQTLPPIESITSGLATIDNTTADWINDNGISHFYDNDKTAWVPHGMSYQSLAPSDIAAGVSNAAATYTTTLWQDSDDFLIRYWDGDSWELIGGGTVTSVGLALPTSVFDISGSPVTSSGTLTASFDNQSANTVFAGPTTGGAATPAFRALVAADITTGGGIVGSGVKDQISIFSGTAQTIFGSSRFTVNNSSLAGLIIDGGDGAGGNGSYIQFRKDGANNFIFGAESSLFGGTGLGGAIFQYGNNPFFICTNSNKVMTITGTGSVGIGNTSPQQTLHVAGTARITGSDGTATTIMGRDADGDISALSLSGMSISSGTLTATDPSLSNEGVLGVGAGSGTSSTLLSTTSGANAVTINAAGILGITESTSVNGGSITLTATEVDGSVSNELQTIANTSDATSHTVTLSNSGGSVQLAEGTGVTLTTTGTGSAGVVTIASTNTGTLTGNGVAPRIPYYNGTTSFANIAGFNFDATNKYLQISEEAGTPTTSAASLDIRYGTITGNREWLRVNGNLSGNLTSTMFNTRNLSGTGNSIFSVVTGGASGGDPMTQYIVSGQNTWSVGVDNDNNDAFRILNQPTPSSGDIAGEGIRIETGTVSRVGINKTVAIEVLDVGGNVRGEMWKNVSTASAIGTYALGTGAGTGATISTGNTAWWGNGGYFNITTGTSPATNAIVMTVTMAAGYKYNTRASAIVQGKNSAGALTGWYTTYDNTTGILSIKYASALPASTVIEANILMTGL